MGKREIQFVLIGITLLVALVAGYFGIVLPEVPDIVPPPDLQPSEEIRPQSVRERISFYAKEDGWMVNGSDIEWYSDNRGTMVAEIDGTGGNIRIAAPTAVGTATPIINIENDSVADSIVSRNAAGTPTWILDKAGNVTASGTSSGPYDLNGNALTIDADADTTMQASTDDVVNFTTLATGTINVLTGNLKIGNGSPGTSQDGEDAYVEGLLEVDGGATLGGTITLDAGEIGAGEIADVTRVVNLPLHSWIECTTDGGADLDYTSGADAFPDLIGLSTDGQGFNITFDDTGGSVDTAMICSNLLVPADYSSGGAVIAKVSKDAETGANTEVLNCAGSINAAALGAAGTTTVTTSTITSLTCTPTLSGLAAGDALGIELHITSGGTVDDAVLLHGVEFSYTATQ